MFIFYLVKNLTNNIKRPCFPPPRITASANLEKQQAAADYCFYSNKSANLGLTIYGACAALRY